MLKLPKIALYEIVTKLNLSDLRSLCQTTKKYNKICVDESFWKFKFRREFGELPMSNYLSYRELYIWRLWSNLNFYRPRSWIRLLFPDNSLRQNVKKNLSGLSQYCYSFVIGGAVHWWYRQQILYFRSSCTV